MLAPRVDKLTLLLSTDWFFDYWATIGLNVDNKKKTLFQQSCRELTKGFMLGAAEYWLVSFADSRILETEECFFRSAKNSGIEKSIMANIISKKSQESVIKDNASWIFASLNEMAISGTEKINGISELDPTLRNLVGVLWRECDIDEIDFEEVCLSSDSQWDKYIRSVTPDLPTMLSDFVSAELVPKDRFAYFWEKVSLRVNPKQKDMLVQWYKESAYSLTEEEIAFPI